MKFTRSAIGACALLLLLPFQVAAQNIEVTPTTWDYGGVELGTSEPMSFIIESLGPDTELRVDVITILDDDIGVFDIASIIPEITFPHYLDVGEILEVTVNFAPTGEGFASASLYIASNAHNGTTLYIPLQGQGIVEEPTPDEMMDDLMEFFNDGVANGEICGVGNGSAPTAHLRVFASMLDSADDLIVQGDYEAACDQLDLAARKSNGMSPPPDFIDCGGASTVNSMILEVMSALGC